MSVTDYSTNGATVEAATPSILDRLGARLGAIMEVMVNASHGMKCAREAQRLSALSDAELARVGITRDGIIRHAFRGYV